MGLQASCQGTARIHLVDARILLLAQIKNQDKKEEPGGHFGAKAPAQGVQTTETEFMGTKDFHHSLALSLALEDVFIGLDITVKMFSKAKIVNMDSITFFLLNK